MDPIGRGFPPPLLGHVREGHSLDGLHTGSLFALGAFFLLWIDSHYELVLESVFQLPRIGKPNERVRSKLRPFFFPIQPVTEHSAFGTALFHQEHKPIAIRESSCLHFHGLLHCGLPFPSRPFLCPPV